MAVLHIGYGHILINNRVVDLFKYSDIQKIDVQGTDEFGVTCEIIGILKIPIENQGSIITEMLLQYGNQQKAEMDSDYDTILNIFNRFIAYKRIFDEHTLDYLLKFVSEVRFIPQKKNSIQIQSVFKNPDYAFLSYKRIRESIGFDAWQIDAQRIDINTSTPKINVFIYIPPSSPNAIAIRGKSFFDGFNVLSKPVAYNTSVIYTHAFVYFDKLVVVPVPIFPVTPTCSFK